MPFRVMLMAEPSAGSEEKNNAKITRAMGEESKPIHDWMIPTWDNRNTPEWKQWKEQFHDYDEFDD